MAKTLKEALLEQMTTLQERGLAPGEIPEEEDETSYASYEVEVDRRSPRADRDGDSRRAPAGRSTRVRPRTSAVRQQHEPRELRKSRPSRERREPRAAREEGLGREPRELPYDLAGRSPAPERPVSSPRPAARPALDRQFPENTRPAPRADLLRRNAERIQREQAAQDEIRQLLTSYAGEEPDATQVDRFFEQLTIETGALPPLEVVAIALRSAGKADPADVGHQVRLHYRNGRSRVAAEPVSVG